jgi:hypothetical protein
VTYEVLRRQKDSATEWATVQSGADWLSLFQGWPIWAYLLRTHHLIGYVEWSVNGGGTFAIRIQQ